MHPWDQHCLYMFNSSCNMAPSHTVLAIYKLGWCSDAVIFENNLFQNWIHPAYNFHFLSSREPHTPVLIFCSNKMGVIPAIDCDTLKKLDSLGLDGVELGLADHLASTVLKCAFCQLQLVLSLLS